MSAIHYNPYANSTYDPYGEDYNEKALCGTTLPEDGDETNDKKFVTCKKCIKKFISIDNWVKETEEHILNDMQGFVDFMESENKTSKHKNN